MKLHRVWAQIKRHLYLLPRSYDRLTDIIFWPILDIGLWGLTSVWLADSGTKGAAAIFSVITAIVFWRIVWQAKSDFAMNILEECWNRNVSNVISSPLSKAEWMAANIISGLVKLLIVVILCAGTAYVLHKVVVFDLGWKLIPYFVSLLFFGWGLGFLASALLLHWGIRAQSITWILGFIFAPFCAVYYPVSYPPLSGPLVDVV